ncbi:MAG: mannose-6-phosphate isomerase, class I, partial [Myxococcales bacterium]|nr:mannose-6-phosphate isomerase, class I [Polyangiaceae bacterium]MDW8252066.1 mannose-6-phosphate isomerase, class I [Myxococcales bacterium]
MTSAAPTPLRLVPSVQHYAWGDPAFLPDLLGVNSDGKPWAEAWYGAHPSAPSTVFQGEQVRPLDVLLTEAPGLLGERVLRRFGRLPFLLKILAAHKPLSIQVHPSEAQAAEGFSREQEQRIPLNAPQRSYRDPYAKPELLVALTNFRALCGFRPPEQIAAALRGLPELQELLPPFLPNDTGLRRLLEAYFALPSPPLTRAWEQVLVRLSGRPLDQDDPAFWAMVAHRELAEDKPPDRGLLFVFLLELIHLTPGQGIFLPARVPHAYLQGCGIELMGNSDNVLRAGLTPKHIDPQELLRVARFDACVPIPLAPFWDEAQQEGTFPTPSDEFELSQIRIVPGLKIERSSWGPEILLSLPNDTETQVQLVYANGVLKLLRGQAAFVPAGVSYRVEASGEASVFRAVVPGGGEVGGFRGRHPARLAFGTSGLRGLITDITDLEVYVNTRGFLDFLVATGDAAPGTTVALAGDLRPSTDSPTRSILRAVARAVEDSGMRPLDLGKIPTPALTLYSLEQGIPGVMVTGSHIPFDRNGIKFIRSSGEVLKEDENPILEAVGRV